MAYDMSGFDYDIRDVVRVLNLRVKHKNASSYDVDCPFCGNQKGKLNVNIIKNVFRCNYCGEHGGMLDLYGKLYGLSTSEANRQIREALNLGQYRDDYRVQVRETEPPPIENSELASETEIDKTYSRMLSLLSLNPKHQEDLMKRGLSLAQIGEQRYRSVPLFGVKSMVKKLTDVGCTVQGVPGFYLDNDGQWTIHFSAKNSGILIPILSLCGRIQGFQIRLDHVTDSRKYIWLSSTNYHKGVSSGSPVHIIGNRYAKEIYVTEGALKGTIAHYLTGHTFVCVAGVNQHRNLKPVLEALCQCGAESVVEAYDMDKKMKTDCNRHYSKCKSCMLSAAPKECPYKAEKRRIIQSGCQKVYDICRGLSLPVHRCVWDMDQDGNWNGDVKGIDDFIYKEKLDEKKS